MTKKEKTEKRKNRNLNELKTVRKNDRKALSEKQGGSVNPFEITSIGVIKQ